MSFSMNDQPSIISHAKLITNSFVLTHNIHSTCISTPFIHNKSLNQPNKQPSTFIQQSIAKTKLGLVQAGSPRLGERSALAQAADSRLGETTTVPLEGFANSRLGKAVSPGRDFSSLKNISPRLGERSSRNLSEFPLFSPRRDELAWVSILVLTTVPRMFNQGLTHDNTQSIFYIIISNILAPETQNRTNAYKK